MVDDGAYENLVEEILNELLLEWPRRQQSVKVGTQQLGDEVTGRG